MTPSIKVRRHKCPECAAHLEIRDDAKAVRCAYCGNTLTIEHERPPRHAAEAPRTIYVPAGPGPGVRLAQLAGAFTPLVIAAAVFWPHLKTHLPFFGNRLPVECSVNGEVRIIGLTYKGKGPLVRGGTNCTVHIENSTLESDDIIEGGVNLELEIVHSTLTATHEAIHAGANAKVRITDKSDVRGDAAALELGSNAKVRLDDSALTSARTALRADSNLTLEANGGAITGITALEASGYAERLDLVGTRVTGARKAKQR